MTIGTNWLIGYRVIFGLLGFSALVTEIATVVERGTFKPWNFFSFFTIQANTLAVAILILSALALAGGDRGRRVSILRGANTLYMVVVGVVFSLLLAGLENTEFTAVPWDNIVLHYVMPVAVALDWIADRHRTRITFREASVWLAFPLAYLVYSLVRGPIVDWYPYPFLNADQHGYLSVARTSIVLLVAAAGLVWLLARTSGRAPAGRAA